MEKQSKTLKLSDRFPALQRYCPHDPHANAKQAAFLLCPNLEGFYGGAAGGGKSDALLAGALEYADVPSYSAILFRRTYADLARPGALMDRSQEWLKPTDARWNHETKTWTFPSGAKLAFGYLENENDVYHYQSAEFQYIGFDELTQFTESQYTYLFSRLRRLKDFPVPLRMRAASNPGGVGHGWVKRRFISERKPGVVFIPAGVFDSAAYLDVAEYERSLAELHPVLRRQLLQGDWGAFEGAAFEQFSRALHCVEPFAIPADFERFESMDYGLTNPTAWIAWAVDYDGNHISFDLHYAPGLPSETAPIIRKLRQCWGSYAAVGDPASLASPTSTLTKMGEKATIQTEFAEQGIPIGKANNNPRAGYTRLRELLRPDATHRFPDWHPRRGELGSPRWFIFEQPCAELVEQLETAPLQPLERRWAGEMIDPKWESAYGHAVAAARYGAMSRPGASLRPEPVPETPDEVRQELLEQIWRGERPLATTNPY